MQELIERVFTDPTFMWVGLVVAVMLTLAIFKKLFKVVIIIVSVFIIYSVYLYNTGGRDPIDEISNQIKDIDTKKIKKKIGKSAEELKDKTEDMIEKIKKNPI